MTRFMIPTKVEPIVRQGMAESFPSLHINEGLTGCKRTVEFPEHFREIGGNALPKYAGKWWRLRGKLVT